MVLAHSQRPHTSTQRTKPLSNRETWRPFTFPPLAHTHFLLRLFVGQIVAGGAFESLWMFYILSGSELATIVFTKHEPGLTLVLHTPRCDY